MNGSFFVRGLLIGLSIAAGVGPMSILCIQRTLRRGQRYGLVSGLGIATADATYGSIAAFGLTLITSFLVSQQFWIRLIGGLFLLYLGMKTLLSKPAEQAATAHSTGYISAYTSTFLLTLTNPMTILSFVAIFAGIGVGVGVSGGGGGGGEANRNYASALLVVLGVLLGSVLWWCILTSIVSFLRSKFTAQWLLWIQRVSGGMLVLFGLIALISL